MADFAIIYDRIRPDEKMLFDAMDELGISYEKVYAPQLKLTFGQTLPFKVALERCISQSRGHAITRALEGMNVTVDINEGVSFGRTVCDIYNVLNLSENARVAMKVDADGYFDLIAKRLAMLP